MTPYRFFSLYQGVYLHFTSNYDFIKYQGKSASITEDIFNKRKDRQLFFTWANKMGSSTTTLKFCVFNFLKSDKWIYGDYETAKDVALTKEKFYSTITKNLENDVQYLTQLKSNKNSSFSSLIQPTPGGNRPPLLQAFLKGDVSPEFIGLLDLQLNILDPWMMLYNSDPLLSSELRILKKYSPFVRMFK